MAKKRPLYKQSHSLNPPQSPKRDNDDQTIQLDGKNKTVTLKLSGKGIVLVYAISFVLLVVAIGWVAVQLATAYRLVLTPFGPTMGFLLWASIAFISALLSR